MDLGRTDAFLLVLIYVLLDVSSGSKNRCLVGFYGRECLYRCRCAGRLPCAGAMGTCPRECQPGWSGSSCQTENVAINKPSQQRSTHAENTANKAVDWLPVQTCARTSPGSRGWWRVDLQQRYPLNRIEIQTEPGGDLRDVAIYVGNSTDISYNTLCRRIKAYGHKLSITCEEAVTGQFVQLVDRQRELVLCNIGVYVCSNYNFGTRDCEGICRCNNTTEICDKSRGTCTSGCALGWTGEGCKQVCKGSYGLWCSHRCGHCRDDEPCNPQTGDCAIGCQAGYRGSKCDQACIHGTYGEGCASCGHCQNGQCDHITGHCVRGCEAGWRGPLCKETCPNKLYGENCRSPCGSCRSGTSCDREDGLCRMGCAPGWTGVFCTLSCIPGKYGEICYHPCGKCKNGTCNKITGNCEPGGCQVGWNGPKCDEECMLGTYGKNCTIKCGHCLKGQSCDVSTGDCTRGCDPGWTNKDCKQTCKRGFYGEDCDIACGVCVEGKSCHHVTGKCPGDCAHGYSGPLCQKKLLMDPTRHLLTSVLLGTGSVVVGSLIAFIVCLVIRWRQETIQDDGDDDEKRVERRTPLLHRLESIQNP